MEDDEITISIDGKTSKAKLDNTNKKGKKNKKTNRKTKDKKEKTKRKFTHGFKLFLLIIFCLIIVLILLNSSLFNIREIIVVGNEKVPEEKVIELSEINIGETNLYRFSKKKIKDNVKSNAYVEDVNIKRVFPNKLEIDITERQINFMLQFADSFLYINNQGYMLDISNEKKEVPLIVGFSTDLNNIKTGNRLDIDDLVKMNMVLKIMESAEHKEIDPKLITKINIADNTNYIIELESEGKTVYLGDCHNINEQMIYLKTILDATSGKNGIIFLNIDLNTENVFFRETIN